MLSLQLSQQQLLNGIAVWLSEGSGWIIVSIDDYYINTGVYDVLRGNWYINILGGPCNCEVSCVLGPVSAEVLVIRD